MSGQFPTGVEFSNVTITSNESVLTSRSQSGKRQSRAVGAHLWMISLDLNFMNRDEFNSVWSFLMKQRGQKESFTIIVPGHDIAQGAISGTPTYTSTTNDFEIVTGGWNASVVDNVKACDVFNIAGDSKVYMAVDDMDSDGSGNGNLKFEPALRQTPGASAALTFDNVVFTVSLENKPSYRRLGPFYQIERLKLIEAL